LKKPNLKNKSVSPIRFQTRWTEYNFEYSGGRYEQKAVIRKLSDFAELLKKDDRTVAQKVFDLMKVSSSVPTAYAKNGSRQCRAGASRSALDLWRLYRFYFGDIKFREILNALYHLNEEAGDISTQFCGTVHKRVFWIGDGDNYDREYMDEFGLKFPEWQMK
jgi:hypothetical protein